MLSLSLRYFNPRPPRGGRQGRETVGQTIQVFQSTPPARGATTGKAAAKYGPLNISIHAPREGGDFLLLNYACRRQISIHAPREGGDSGAARSCRRGLKFQSTPPARGATAAPRLHQHPSLISIHAPREGGDPPCRNALQIAEHFNPRPPRGGRQVQSDAGTDDKVFQSTPPARGATKRRLQLRAGLAFQSTPPARGATILAKSACDHLHNFNPRPPRGGRQQRE